MPHERPDPTNHSLHVSQELFVLVPKNHHVVNIEIAKPTKTNFLLQHGIHDRHDPSFFHRMEAYSGVNPTPSMHEMARGICFCLNAKQRHANKLEDRRGLLCKVHVICPYVSTISAFVVFAPPTCIVHLYVFESCFRSVNSWIKTSHLHGSGSIHNKNSRTVACFSIKVAHQHPSTSHSLAFTIHLLVCQFTEFSKFLRLAICLQRLMKLGRISFHDPHQPMQVWSFLNPKIPSNIGGQKLETNVFSSILVWFNSNDRWSSLMGQHMTITTKIRKSHILCILLLLPLNTLNKKTPLAVNTSNSLGTSIYKSL